MTISKRYLTIFLLILIVIMCLHPQQLFYHSAGRENITIYVETDSIKTAVNTIVSKEKLMPGQEFDHEVTFQNTSDKEVWLCVSLDINTDDPELLSDNLLCYSIDSEYWELNNGCYYYRKLLNTDDVTPPLIKTIRISDDIDNKYINHDIFLTIHSYVITNEATLLPRDSEPNSL